jgi:heme/copper-type cytochrome/quinol oxidase subunit 2
VKYPWEEILKISSEVNFIKWKIAEGPFIKLKLRNVTRREKLVRIYLQSKTKFRRNWTFSQPCFRGFRSSEVRHVVSGSVILDLLKGHNAFAMSGITDPEMHHHIPEELNQLNLSSDDQLHTKHITSHKINFYEISNTMAMLSTIFRALFKYRIINYMTCKNSFLAKNFISPKPGSKF